MTEQEWLASRDPGPMLKALRGKPNNRKLRLFACACCRRIWPWLGDERSRRAVETAERFADGRAHQQEVWAAVGEAEQAYAEQVYSGTTHTPLAQAAWAASGLAYGPHEDLRSALTTGMWIAREVAPAAALVLWEAAAEGARDAAFQAEKQCQADLLRDLFGNPFRPVRLSPSGLTSSVVRLAQALYDTRDFTALPVLADALEESGCTSQGLFDHLRGPGPHALGCWGLDLVVGKS
jgi:hypothetical protein